MIYVENSMRATKNLLVQTCEFSKVAEQGDHYIESNCISIY